MRCFLSRRYHLQKISILVKLNSLKTNYQQFSIFFVFSSECENLSKEVSEAERAQDKTSNSELDDQLTGKSLILIN